MRRWFLSLVVGSALLLPACKHVIRDPSVYRSEVEFDRKLAHQQAAQLQHWVGLSCKCQDGKFVDDHCRASAKLILLVQGHVDWHADMKLYLAGLIEQRPGELPPLSPTTSLCL